jgi:hypothetical protein
MGIITLFRQGFAVTSKKARLLLYLWLVQVLFSLLVISPFYFLLQRDLSRSILGEKMFQGADMLWLGDLIYKYGDIGPLFLGWLLAAAGIFMLLQLFFNGAILGRIASADGRLSFSSFLADGGRYFGRFFRVFILTLAGYLLIFGLFGRLLSFPFKLWMKNASTQWATFYASSLRLLLFLILFSVVKMFFDYVKVRLVAEDSRKALRAFLLNFPFLGKKFFKAWALFLLVGLVFVAVTAVYLILVKWIPATGIGALLILFLWQQAYVVARLFISVLFLSTEYRFFSAHRPVVLEKQPI